jgi:glutathione S-transferase
MPEIAPGDYEFIGSKNSYYSAKVRACLQYKRIPYSEVCANADTIRRAIELTGSHVYPVVRCPDGIVLQDSCDIVEALEARHPERPVIPQDPVLRLVATLVETVADEFMLRSAIGFRWVPEDTSAWAARMFVQICSERMPDPEARAVARKQGVRIARSIQSRVAGMSEQMLRTSREVSLDLCDRLDAHLEQTPFLLGDRPSLADLGMMNAIYGHLYRDPGEICDHLHWKCISLSLWVEHMLAAAGESDRGGLFLTDGLESVLEGFRVYSDLAGAALASADAILPGRASGEEVGGALEAVEAHMAGTPAPLLTTGYVAWKLQRLAKRYAEVPEAQRAEADRLMERAGFLEVCRHRPSWRLVKRDFRVVVA